MFVNMLVPIFNVESGKRKTLRDNYKEIFVTWVTRSLFLWVNWKIFI